MLHFSEMDTENLKNSISQYKEQLTQISLAISACSSESEKDDLINLKADIEQLIELTEENLEQILSQNEPSTSAAGSSFDDEYTLFMKEMEKEGAVENVKGEETKSESLVKDDLESLVGTKCQAPHKHSWGDTAFHNAMVCGLVPNEEQQTFNEIQVRVMFSHPTHLEMLPCPYYLGSNCKFTDERCKFSHGEVVLLSDLKEFKDPNFEALKVGAKVLAKRPNNLWQRAVLKSNISGECSIKFEANQEEIVVPLESLLPLDDSSNRNESSDTSGSEESSSEAENDEETEWLVQKSLLNNPPAQMLGEWEKHTKGIGSKLMQQMGYVVGTGLGRFAEGRLEPVQAVVLPPGKSLDHCMTLRENAGGDENLFSVERRLKKLQKKQEAQNKKAYEREKKKKDVFEFLNDTLVLSKNKNEANGAKSKSKHWQDIKSGTNRDLNVAGLKIEEDIRRAESELYKIKESLIRHNNPETQIHKNLSVQLRNRQDELKRLHDYSKNVSNEQNLRKDKKKMTVF